MKQKAINDAKDERFREWENISPFRHYWSSHGWRLRQTRERGCSLYQPQFHGRGQGSRGCVKNDQSSLHEPNRNIRPVAAVVWFYLRNLVERTPSPCAPDDPDLEGELAIPHICDNSDSNAYIDSEFSDVSEVMLVTGALTRAAALSFINGLDVAYFWNRKSGTTILQALLRPRLINHNHIWDGFSLNPLLNEGREKATISKKHQPFLRVTQSRATFVVWDTYPGPALTLQRFHSHTSRSNQGWIIVARG